MRHGLLNQAAFGLALLATAAITASCGSGSEHLSGAAELPGTAGDITPATQTPDGISAELWQQLTAELGRVLAEEGTAKRTAAAPTGPGSVTAAPSFYSNPDDALQTYVRFAYRNMGDYDQNGEANVSDLTPIGIHFGKRSTDADWIIAQVADGDGNGEVNISDVTPLGQNFGGRVTGFELQRSDNEGASWELYSDFSFGQLSAPGAGLRYINEPLSAVGAWTRVVPYIDEGEERSYGSEGRIRRSFFGQTGSWSTHRANSLRNGRSNTDGPLDNSEAWSVELEGFLSGSSAVSDTRAGMIYIATEFEDEEAQQGYSHIYGIDLEGSIVWKKTIHGATFCAGTVMYDERVVFGTTSGRVVAFDSDGGIAWSSQASARFGEDPVLRMNDRNIYISGARNGEQFSTVYSLDHNGGLRWAVDLPGFLEEGLVASDTNGELIAVHSFGTGAVRIDFDGNMTPGPVPGDTLLQAPFHYEDYLVSSPTGIGKMLSHNMETDMQFPFETTGVIRGAASVIEDNGTPLLVVGSGETQDNQGHISAWSLSGVYAWGVTLPEPVVSDLVVDGTESIYLTTWESSPEGDYGVYCLNTDGSVKWFSPQPGYRCAAPVIVAHDMLVVTASSDEGSRLIAFGGN